MPAALVVAREMVSPHVTEGGFATTGGGMGAGVGAVGDLLQLIARTSMTVTLRIFDEYVDTAFTNPIDMN